MKMFTGTVISIIVCNAPIKKRELTWWKKLFARLGFRVRRATSGGLFSIDDITAIAGSVQL
ncbi:MAG: hypothetical protein KAJ19_13290 [Gammaproteobacteria bacterium]|nr:hypothetical protein [Gammaproteobacteria bacterium]